MKINQKGRSMVEMLGVLAIIGVLSAGALAGYSKAMFRHKVNQTIDTFSLVLQRFAELEEKNMGEQFLIGDDGDEDSAIDLVKYGFLENCKVAKGGLSYGEKEGCQLPIGILTFDMSNYSKYDIYGWFALTFSDAKSCAAFSSAGWYDLMPKEWINYNGYENASGISICDYKNGGSSNCYGVLQEDTVSSIAEKCQLCDGTQSCYFKMYIKGDI